MADYKEHGSSLKKDGKVEHKDKAERGSSRKCGAEGSSPIKMGWSKWIEKRFRVLY